MPRTLFTFCQVHLHADELDTGEGVIDECKMLVAEVPTVHDPGFEGSKYQYPHGGHWFPNPRNLSPNSQLIHIGRDDLRE